MVIAEGDDFRSVSSCSSSQEFMEATCTENAGPAAPSSSHEEASHLVRQYIESSESDSQSLPASFKRTRSVRRCSTLDQEEQAARCIQVAWRQRALARAMRRRSISQYGSEAVHLLRRYLSGSGLAEAATEPPCTGGRGPRLLLHFDVNKTILISDKAQEASSDHMINMLISECAWGRLQGGATGATWVPVGRLATDRPATDHSLITFRTYLDSFALPFQDGRTPAVKARNTALKHKRQEAKGRFTEAGNPGAMFRGVFEALQAALKMPASAGEHPFFPAREYRILPSFFTLLLRLQQTDRDFTIVFRTFGSDISDVVEEMNLFATGRHPCYPDVRMDGTAGSRTNLLLTQDRCGGFLRVSGTSEGSSLVLPASDAILAGKQVLESDFEACAASQPGAVMHRGFRAVQEAIQAAAAGIPPRSPDAAVGRPCSVGRTQNTALALRDYYAFWKHRNERSKAGKLLLLDATDPAVTQVFFDDNIGYATPHIVDARCVTTGEPLGFSTLRGLHLVKAEPLNAILDTQYFVRALHECETAILDRRRASDLLQRCNSVSWGGKRSGEACAVHRASSKDEACLAVRPRLRARESSEAKRRWQDAGRRITSMLRLRDALSA